MAKNISKAIEDLDKARKQVDKNRERIQLSCDHQKNGEPAIDVIRKDNKTAWKCRKCQKIISQHAPTDAEIEQAVEVLETASDYARMITDPTTEKGQRQCETYGETIMGIKKFEKVYKSLRSEQAKKKEKRNKQKRGDHGGAYYEN